MCAAQMLDVSRVLQNYIRRHCANHDGECGEYENMPLYCNDMLLEQKERPSSKTHQPSSTTSERALSASGHLSCSFGALLGPGLQVCDPAFDMSALAFCLCVIPLE